MHVYSQYLSRVIDAVMHRFQDFFPVTRQYSLVLINFADSTSGYLMKKFDNTIHSFGSLT